MENGLKKVSYFRQKCPILDTYVGFWTQVSIVSKTTGSVLFQILVSNFRHWCLILDTSVQF